MCTVAAIVPVKDDSPAFRRSLAALQSASPAPDERIVVADGPAPAAAAAARAAGCRVVELAQNAGPAAARNAGALAATSDVLLFLDADVEASHDLIARVRRAFSEPSLTAAVGCYDERAPERNFFSTYKNLLQRYVHLRAKREGSTFWGACGAVRRSAFLAVGGFDQRYRVPCIEDIELGYRLKAAGHRIEFRPDLEITHLKRWTLTSLLKSDILRRAVPWTWLLIRRSSIEADLNLGYRSRVAALLAFVLAGSLLAAPWLPMALVLGALAAVALTALDWDLARFFAAGGGLWFAVRAVAWHWVYYLYSAAAFVVATALYPTVGRRQVERSTVQVPPLSGWRADGA